MIKAIIYGQRYIDNQNFDAALFKIGGWGKTINEKLGINVFPENLEGRQVTLNKIVDNLNNSFSIATLGFNLRIINIQRSWWYIPVYYQLW